MKKIKISKREVNLMYKAIGGVIKDYEKTGTSYACVEIERLSKHLLKKYKQFYDREDMIWSYKDQYNMEYSLHGEEIDWRLNLMLLFIEVCK